MEGGERNASQEEESSQEENDQEENNKEENHQEESCQEEKEKVVRKIWIKKGADVNHIGSFFIDNCNNFF
jgi:hypothetical protein